MYIYPTYLIGISICDVTARPWRLCCARARALQLPNLRLGSGKMQKQPPAMTWRSKKRYVMRPITSILRGKPIQLWKDPPCLMGKLTISMAIFNSYFKFPEGNIYNHQNNIWDLWFIHNHQDSIWVWLVKWETIQSMQIVMEKLFLEQPDCMGKRLFFKTTPFNFFLVVAGDRTWYLYCKL